MIEGYQPVNADQAVAWLVEECGEVVQAAGKAYRFGLHATHPDTGVSNHQKLKEEIADLERAIFTVRRFLF